jgi:hypothetical protein
VKGRWWLCALGCAALGCGATGGAPAGQGGAGAGSGAGGSKGNGAGGSTGIAIDGGSGGAGNGQPGCSVASEFVYVIDAAGMLHKFDPATLSFTSIGHVNCNTPIATPFSMAVDRSAHAWVVFTNGRLYNVDTQTAACTPTAFVPNQSGFSTFGMGFSADSAGSTHDTLYVSSDTQPRLAIIDTTTLKLTPIGPYDQLSARAELTGTGDGRLYGAFEGTPYVVAQIDKTNAHIVSQAPQTPIQYAPDTSNFAFAFWGGSFWLFVGPGSSTDVFQFDPSNATTVKRTSVAFEIVGAGVSTCAPLVPPK